MVIQLRDCFTIKVKISTRMLLIQITESVSEMWWALRRKRRSDLILSHSSHLRLGCRLASPGRACDTTNTEPLKAKAGLINGSHLLDLTLTCRFASSHSVAMSAEGYERERYGLPSPVLSCLPLTSSP